MFYLFARFVLRPLFWVAFRPTVVGRDNVPLSGPVILASNHLSFIDSIAIPLMAPRRVSYLAKAEYWQGAGIGGWVSRGVFTRVGALPGRRGGPRAGPAGPGTPPGVVTHGGGVGLYP